MQKNMENIENRIWDITCSEETFNSLRADDKFLNLLALARSVNALRFCFQPVIDAANSDKPSASRQRINSFLFASSVLYEGFLLVENLGKYFRDSDSFKNGFAIMLRDEKIRKLRTSALKRMRNKFVFHFDPDVPLEALTNFDLPNYRFATGFGKATGEIYYGLADEAFMNYLLESKPEDTDETLNLHLRSLIKDVKDVMVKFNKSAELLIAEALLSMGWTVKIRE